MNVKKLISMVLALVMLLAMSATAMAYTISAPDNGHTYEVYQIFTGDLHEGTLSNIKWGKNGTGTEDELVGEDVLAELEAVNLEDKTDTEKLAVILNYANLNAENKYGTATNAVALENVPAGYYLIKDIDGVFNDQYDSYTTYIVKVVSDVTIDPKSSVPEVVKKVDDKNDSDAEENGEGWQDSADYDIGDNVPFQLTATLGDDLRGYETYKIVFHDTLSAGLTYNTGSYEVTIDGNDVTDDFTANSNGTSLTFSCDNVIALGAHANSVIIVTYTAKLNENAVIGFEGNPNEVYLEFTNNPNVETETGKTPSDKVIVFTYKVVVDKMDENDQPLVGATFKLSKLVNGAWVEVDTIAGTNLTTFTWTGLDDGDYKLEETVTPAGYNTIEEIVFTIAATHEEEADDPKLESITVTGGDFTVVMVTDEDNNVVKDEKGNGLITGELTADVVNEKGATLPETGAQGTKMLYIVGGILVAAAVVLLIVKRRMDSAE